MRAQQLNLWPQATAPAPLRWSVSRAQRLRTCARRYYLHHYASQGGKSPHASATVRAIYMLKHLRNRFMWVGEIVHGLIAEVLLHYQQAQQAPPEKALLASGLQRMRQQFQASKQGLYRQRPGEVGGLLEHEYAEPLSAADWQALRARLERCVHNFYRLPLLQTLQRVPRWGWLAMEDLGSLALAGARVCVKPDVAWRNPQGQVEIVDWKTGNSKSSSVDGAAQLAVYAFYAQRVWGLGDSQQVLAHLVYLDNGVVDTSTLHVANLAAAEAHINSSVAQMHALASFAGDPTAFAQSDDLQTCARCNFRRVCQRG